MSARAGVIAAALATVVAGAIPAPAAAVTWDDPSWLRLRAKPGLHDDPGARMRKRPDGTDRSVGWSIVGATSAGSFSNAFRDPVDPTRTTAVAADLRIGAAWAPSAAERFRLRLESSNLVLSESREASEHVQRLELDWRRALGPAWTLLLDSGVKHENDDVVLTEGHDPTRDFEHTAWSVEPTVRWEPADATILRLSWLARRTDHVETPGLDELDFWRHGPRLEVYRGLTDRLGLRVKYSLRFERYDEQPARDAGGSRTGPVPIEHHRFHAAGARLEWRASRRWEAHVLYERERKDDRFEDYESYDDDRGEAGVVTEIAPRWRASLTGSFARRSHDHRPADDGLRLRTDLLSADLATTWAVTPGAALFLAYGFDHRSSNRSFGREWLDYTGHRILSGLSFHY